MLAVVKKPPIEFSINGEGAKEAMDWLARKFRLQVISDTDEKVNIEDTDFYHEMEVNRSGNLLEAARLKAGLSQKQLADAAGVRQTMISEFENGRRRITGKMAGRFAKVLKIKRERLI
ncbi:MAG: helix-turn-helix transcriptional regulator [Chitinivibrionales bacterium]|nr:helix-turn-helix transcriptional regulator [Chitinivibrionales bacterium]